MTPKRKFIRKCSISGCTNSENQKNVTLFKVCDTNKVAWELAVHSNINTPFKSLKYICSKHFSPNDVITQYAQTPSDIMTPKGFDTRDKFALKKGAIPLVFEQSNTFQPLPEDFSPSNVMSPKLNNNI